MIMGDTRSMLPSWMAAQLDGSPSLFDIISQIENLDATFMLLVEFKHLFLSDYVTVVFY